MKNLILDASNLLHRTFHTSLTSPYESAHVYAFLNYLKTFVEKFEPDQIFFCWDESEHYKRDNFRYSLIKEYKAQRNRENDDKLHQYDQDLYELTTYLGCYNLFPKHMECDDTIAWLCLEKYTEDENIVVSSDKDFLQLINYNHNVKVYSPNKRILIDYINFEEHEKISPSDFLRAKVIMGDTSDNIAGIYGYGPVKSKRAAKDWKNFTLNLDEDNKKRLGVNVQMMDLRRGYKYYPDEAEFLENQIKVTPEKDFYSFFSKCRELNLGIISNCQNDWKQSFNRISLDVEFAKYFGC
jgi:5'-3' exonuclease